MRDDPTFKKRIEFALRGRRLRFDVSTDLFSSHAVDAGSRLLIRSLEGVVLPKGPLLDLGCGYGPIGLSLGVPGDREALLVDRDALAVEYARANAVLNGLAASATAATGLGYDDLGRRRFGLIASNLPAKAGEPVIGAFLADAACFIERGGRVAVVVIAPLAALVAGMLEAIEGVKAVSRSDARHYSVFHFEAAAREHATFAPAFDRGVYERGALTYDLDGRQASLRTVWGLPEFDTLSYESAALIDGIGRLDAPTPECLLVMRPGQGHAAVAAFLKLRPARIVLSDRDLLALRATRRNLERNGCPSEVIAVQHAPRAPSGAADADLVIARLREDEGFPALRSTVDASLARLRDGGRMLLACSSTAAARLASAYRTGAVRVEELRRERRVALLSLTPRR